MSDNAENFKIGLYGGIGSLLTAAIFLFSFRDIPVLYKLIWGMLPAFISIAILFLLLAFVGYLGIRTELKSMREVKIVQKTLKGHRVEQGFVEFVRQDNGLTTATAYDNNKAAIVTMQLRNGKLIDTQFQGDE
ncbi:MAG: hypothetical protein ACQEXV_22595 [Bacillota bacterium]